MIYLIQCGEDGPIKIGYASSVDRRVRYLQTGSPHKLVVLHSFEGDKNVERALHRCFKEHRLTGEWFAPAPAILALKEMSLPAINLLVKAYPFKTAHTPKWRGDDTMRDGLEKAVKAAGGEQTMLAVALQVTPQFINTSLRKGYLPLSKAQMVADMYGIPLVDLVRDDIRAAMLRNS